MRLSTFLALLSSSAMLSACGGTAENEAATETRLDDLDSLEGTISDDAIDTDRSTEEGPIEAVPATPSAVGGQRPVTSEEQGGPEVVTITPKADEQVDTE